MSNAAQAINFHARPGGLSSFIAALAALRAGALALQVRAAALNCAATWAAMPTAAQRADGSLSTLDIAIGTGTASVAYNSSAVTFSTAQTGLTGRLVVFPADPTGGACYIAGGSGLAWSLQSPYMGPALAGTAWGTVAPIATNPIVSPGSPPTPLLPPQATLVSAQSLVSSLLAFLSGGTVTATNWNTTIDALNG